MRIGELHSEESGFFWLPDCPFGKREQASDFENLHTWLLYIFSILISSSTWPIGFDAMESQN